MTAPDQENYNSPANDHTAGRDARNNDQPEFESIPLEQVGTQKDLSDSENSGKDIDRHISTQNSLSLTTTDTETQASSIRIKNAGQLKWYQKLNPLKRGNAPPPPKERQPCREHDAGFFSVMTFHWISPLMKTGYQRPLEYNDIWSINPDRSAELLKNRLHENFEKRRSTGAKRPLTSALYDTFRYEFWIGGICQLISSCLQALSPFVLRYLINFATQAWFARINPDLPTPSIGRGIGMVIGIAAMLVTQTLCTNHFLYRGMTVGGQARAVLIAVIFDKAMKLSGRAKAGTLAADLPPPEMKAGSEDEKKWYKHILHRNKVNNPKSKNGQNLQGWSNGRIIALMATDTHRVDTASGMFHMVWTSPVMIALSLALLIVNISYSALAGFGLLIIAIPLLGRAIRSLFVRRIAINKVTDQRVALTQEIIGAVRFVKYFGWELSFLERLSKIRTKEIRGIQLLLSIRNAILAAGMVMPVFASMLAFITYNLTGNHLDPAPIFSSLALFNGLRLPLNFLPMILGQIIDALTSLERIQEFLLAEEANDEAIWDTQNHNAIDIEQADFTWERTIKEEEEGVPSKKGKKNKKAAALEKNRDSASTLVNDMPFKIQGIDLHLGRDELVAVIGTVGCGKTSLLAALAGDMRRTAGQVTFGASRAYCPQYAWIQNATVRDNIVFGRPFDQKWYDMVIDACALRPDLDILPNGDQTEIGEKGITVSGGQKQRLNIARAIYFNADIVLMDDPLSAVDAHVGKIIMDDAICGLLRNKCRVLATHQLHVLNRCDRIILMDEGRIAAVDTFENLMSDNKIFQRLMEQTAVEKKEEEEETKEGGEKKTETKKKKQKKGAALMQQEERSTDNAGWPVYVAYVKAAGGVYVAPLVITLLILVNGATVVTSLWLSWWTSNKFGFQNGVYIGVYAGLGATQAFLTFGFSVALSYYSTEAGKTMLHRAIYRVMRAPMSFFDTTPLGRITNRFSKDIDTMDNNLGDSWRMFLMTMSMIISIFALIIAYFHYFAIALVPLFFVFLFSAAYYRTSAREVKRHESVLRSHVFSRFSEAVGGTATIRAYGLQDQFARTTTQAIDNMNSAYFLTFANQRWLSVRLDAIGNLLVFVTGILVVTSRFNVDPSISGLVLSYVLSVVQMIQFTVRQLAEVENNMNAAERIHHYGTELEQEAPLQLGEVRPSWPERGEIVFDKVQMRYREGLPLVLRDLSMHVRGGERIGVVGRTGAGKSSIMSTIFRLIETSAGSITIDGVDISKIGLHDLRSRLAIIPQDPTLFRGTVRSNLDPFNEHTDLELWSALRQAYLVGEKTGDEAEDRKDKKNRIQLDTTVEEEGLNFSLGQRQLMALARALVRGAQIIICDEATSSVDMETDSKIQQTMAEGFRGKTLLCIAHRLKTIIGYDRICVMDKGSIAELDTPLNLFDMNGIFRSMCDRSGIRRQDIVQEAREMYRMESYHSGVTPAARGSEGFEIEQRISGEGQRGSLRPPIITRQWSEFQNTGFVEQEEMDLDAEIGPTDGPERPGARSPRLG